MNKPILTTNGVDVFNLAMVGIIVALAICGIFASESNIEFDMEITNDTAIFEEVEVF